MRGWLIVGGRIILGGAPPLGLTGLGAIPPIFGLGGACTGGRTGSGTFVVSWDGSIGTTTAFVLGTTELLSSCTLGVMTFSSATGFTISGFS